MVPSNIQTRSQGHLIVHRLGEERDGKGGLAGQAPTGGGDLRGAGETDQGDGGVADGGHHPWNLTDAHERAVFPEADSAQVMGAVLDVPAVADQGQQADRVCVLDPQTGDAIDRFLLHLAAANEDTLALQAKDLLGAGPVPVPRRGDRQRQPPPRAAAVPRIPALGGLPGRIAAGLGADATGEAKVAALSSSIWG